MYILQGNNNSDISYFRNKVLLDLLLKYECELALVKVHRKIENKLTFSRTE